jgi:hypothetical protein
VTEGNVRLTWWIESTQKQNRLGVGLGYNQTLRGLKDGGLKGAGQKEFQDQDKFVRGGKGERGTVSEIRNLSWKSCKASIGLSHGLQ